MATLYEYYNTGDDDAYTRYGSYWAAQTFTPSTAHKITSVKLKLFRVGSPGTITVSIRATFGGKPTGGDLCVGTTDGNSLTTSTAGEWREITLGAGYNLNAFTKYAIVVRATSGDGANLFQWRWDGSSPTYEEGNAAVSSNSGSLWDGYTEWDFMFEDWGEEIPVDPPTVTTQAVDDILPTTATGNGNMTDNGGENASKRGVCWNTTGNPTVMATLYEYYNTGDDNKSPISNIEWGAQSFTPT
ncbi:unnamed protein product, partial [marine sediment metagenome]